MHPIDSVGPRRARMRRYTRQDVPDVAVYVL
jgi:hypothetical protein